MDDISSALPAEAVPFPPAWAWRWSQRAESIPEDHTILVSSGPTESRWAVLRFREVLPVAAAWAAGSGPPTWVLTVDGILPSRVVVVHAARTCIYTFLPPRPNGDGDPSVAWDRYEVLGRPSTYDQVFATRTPAVVGYHQGAWGHGELDVRR